MEQVDTVATRTPVKKTSKEENGKLERDGLSIMAVQIQSTYWSELQSDPSTMRDPCDQVSTMSSMYPPWPAVVNL